MSTILSARFANPDATAVIAFTKDNGAVALSRTDTPAEWAAMLASGLKIDPWQAPVIIREIHIAWFEAALADMGNLDAVNAAVKLAGPVSAALWNRVTTVREDNDDVKGIAAALKIDLPAVFDRAKAIRAAKG